MGLKDQLNTLIKGMQDIVDAAKNAGRDLTSDEAKKIETDAKTATEIRDRIQRIEAGEKSLAELAGTKTIDDDAPKHLALTGAGSKRSAVEIKTALHEYNEDRLGTKAFTAPGAVTVPTPFESLDVDETPRTPTSLLDLIRVQQHSTPTWRGIRQSGFTNNASIVPPGATKPTSTISVTNYDGHLVVLAHLSEALDVYMLADNANLTDFIQGQLLYGLALELEEEVFNGDGSTFQVAGTDTKHLTGIMHTTGVQQQEFTTDMVTTLRAAATRLEVANFTTDVFVLNPNDWAAIETHRNLSGQFDLGSAVNRATRQVWSTPVVTSTKLEQGQALALDLSALNVDTDTLGIQIAWTNAGPELFDKNQAKARVEGRFGFSVRRPEGIVVVDLDSAA